RHPHIMLFPYTTLFRSRPALRQVHECILAFPLVAQRVLGVVERGARKPLRTGHLAATQHARRRPRESHAAELDDRLPEAFEVLEDRKSTRLNSSHLGIS